jgi:hypothetical protein
MDSGAECSKQKGRFAARGRTLSGVAAAAAGSQVREPGRREEQE